MRELIAQWRSEANFEPAGNREDRARQESRIETLGNCADALEQAWHDHAHDGAWEDGCPICDRERANA